MENVLEFLRVSAGLKTVRRKGWQLRGIENAESVADHAYHLALMTYVLAQKHPEGVNRDRCVALALVHDLAETIVGDITPHDGVSKQDKSHRERDAMDQLSEIANVDLKALWQEYEAGQTPEAKFVKSLDKLEVLIQAQQYESSFPDVDLSEFWTQAQAELSRPQEASNIQDRWVRQLIQHLLDERAETMS